MVEIKMAGIPLNKIGKAIVYNAPSTSTAIVKIKTASYEKGEYPEHLREYAADKTGISSCPIQCKGKKGLNYSGCLRKCASEVLKIKPPKVVKVPA